MPIECIETKKDNSEEEQEEGAEEADDADVTLQLQQATVAVSVAMTGADAPDVVVDSMEEEGNNGTMGVSYEFDIDAKVEGCGIKTAKEADLHVRSVCLVGIAAVLEAESQAAGKDNKLYLSKSLLNDVVAMCLSVLRDVTASDKELRSALKAINSCAARLVPSIVSPTISAEAIDSIISTYKEKRNNTDTSFALLSIYQNLPTLEADLVEAIGLVFSTTSSSPRSSSLPPHSRNGLIEFISEAVAIAAGQVPGASRNAPPSGQVFAHDCRCGVNALSDVGLREQSIYILSTLHSMVVGQNTAYAGDESGSTAVLAMIEGVKTRKTRTHMRV